MGYTSWTISGEGMLDTILCTFDATFLSGESNLISDLL